MSERAALLPLTSLRFFASAAIVTYHYGNSYRLFEAHYLANGVSFFFVLSGFILTYSYPNIRGRITYFYVARFARLWPVHVVTLLLAIITLNLPLAPLPILFSNLTMTHAWVPQLEYVFSYNGVSWSISNEIFFYLVFPLLVTTRRFLFVYLTCVALVLTLVVIAGGRLQGIDIVVFVCQNPIVRVLEFATGIGVAKIFAHRKISATTALEVLAVAAVVLWVWLKVPLQNYAYNAVNYGLSAWIAQCGGLFVFAAMIYVFACGQGMLSRALSVRALVRLGEISFCTYMLHQLVDRAFVLHGLRNVFGWWPSLFVVLAISYAGSFILWIVVETPARRWMMSRFRNKYPSRRIDLPRTPELSQNQTEGAK